MGITRGMARLAVVVAATTGLAGCAGSTPSGDCVSRYETLGTASSWSQLRSRLLEVEQYGDVAGVRTQAEGGVRGGGRDRVDRVIDLVDRRRHRLVQADVWRDASDRWHAAVWHQCTD